MRHEVSAPRVAESAQAQVPHDLHVVVLQEFFKLVDLIIAARPHVFGHQVVDPHNQHIFVVGAIEDSDIAVFGNGLMYAPEVFVRRLLRGGLFE